MGSKVLLISEQQIKNQSNIEGAVDGKTLSKVILNVQQIHLKGILGEDLYNELLDAVELNVLSGTTLSTTFKTLLDDYVQPYLIYAVTSEFVVINNYKITNKGLLRMNDGNANSVNPQELEYLKNYFDNYSSQLKANLVKFLVDNNLITSYSGSTINTTSTSIGWWLKN